MYDLRGYQIDSLEAIREMKKGENGIISLPMGSGKTIIMAKAASEIDGRILIVVPSTELREQTLNKLKEIIIDENITIGSVQGKLDEVDADICVCTRQSLTHKKSTRMERMKEYGLFSIIFFDECHQAPLQLEKVVKELSGGNSKIIGMTATPFNTEMRRIFDKIIYEKDVLWMIEHEYLCEPKSFTVNTRTNLNNVKIVAGEFNQRELEETINTSERNNLVVESYKKYADDKKHTIVFCSGIDHCRDLSDAFTRDGIKCGYVDSTLSIEDRTKVISDFKNGNIEVICNVGVLTTGFDYPPTDCILVARPMKSKILFLQSIGRGLRLSDGKDDCLILDFKDILNKHSLVNLNSIFDVEFNPGETLTEAKKRKKKEDEDRIKAIEEERIRQEEIIAKEIDMFNNNVDIAIEENSYYDWFKVNHNMFALSQENDLHYVITRNDNEFNCYEVDTEKGSQCYEELDSFSSILEAISYIENKVHNASGGYPYKNTKWKKEDATEKQLKCIKYNNGDINSKWDCHIYFTKYKIKQCFKRCA